MADLEQRSESRIRILRLIGRLNRGGPTRQAQALARYLPCERFETILAFGEVAPGEEEDAAPFHGEKAFLERISSMQRGIHPWRDLQTTWRIGKLLRREKPQILHTHLAKAGALGRLAACFSVGSAKPRVLVHTFHGTNFSGHMGPWASRASMWLERRLAKRCQALVAVSESVKEELLAQRIAPESKIVVIPPGLELEPFLSVNSKSGALREMFRIPASAPLVGFSGRLVPVKNPMEFAEAAAAVSIAMPQAHFVVLGDGPMRLAMQRSVEALGFRDRFHFAGWRDDMPACLADLDLLVSCSHSEGMPVGLIEAMAAGCAIVANPIGGIPQLLGEGKFGTLVRAENGETLETAILRVLGDSTSRAALAAAAREEARARFGGQRLAQDLAQLYEVLLSGESAAQFRSAACR